MIKFEGIQIKTPQSYKVSNMDISKAERNVQGKMLIDRIATKRKIELSWNYISQEEANKIINILTNNVFFRVEYIDLDGEIKSSWFYAGDRGASVMDYRNGVVRWKDFSFNIIEQ